MVRHFFPHYCPFFVLLPNRVPLAALTFKWCKSNCQPISKKNKKHTEAVYAKEMWVNRNHWKNIKIDAENHFVTVLREFIFIRVTSLRGGEKTETSETYLCMVRFCVKHRICDVLETTDKRRWFLHDPKKLSFNLSRGYAFKTRMTFLRSSQQGVSFKPYHEASVENFDASLYRSHVW